MNSINSTIGSMNTIQQTTIDTISTSMTEDKFSRAELNIYYTVCEILVAVFAVVGNAMVIIVFHRERRLRRRTNYYIVSLAVADFLVGLLGIPFAIMASIGLPTNLYACLFTVSLLVVLCTISIFCLVAVSVDRYWAILHPMAYSRNVRTKTALVIISICWASGSFIGFLPLFGWHRKPNHNHCLFVDVMDYNYLVFLYFTTIITPSLVLVAFYAHIYRVILKQLRQIVTMNPLNIEGGSRRASCSTGNGTMLRMLGAAQKREVKATQILSVIVLFFMICWLPLYTINCIQAFCSTCIVNETLMKISIILSHLNSAGNPLLYAYHLKDFRAALKLFIYNLIGLQAEGIPVDNMQQRPSIASNLYFKQYNNSINQRGQSSLDNKNLVALSQQNKLYMNSPVMYSNRLTKNVNLNAPHAMSSLVTGAAAVVALTTKADIRNRREIFKITEAFSENDASQMQDVRVNENLRTSISANSLHTTVQDITNERDNVILVSSITPKSIINVDNIEEETRVYPFTCLSCSSSQVSHSLLLIENGEPNSSIEKDSNTIFLKNYGEDELKKGTIMTTNLNSFKLVKDILYTHSPSSNFKYNDK